MHIYDKGDRPRIFYIYSSYIKIGVKSLLSKGGGTGWGYMWAPVHLL